MTRKHVNTRAVLPIRQPTAAGKTTSNMYIHEDLPQGSCSEAPPMNYNHTQMFCFGDVSNVNVEFAGYNNLLPYTVPTLQFYAPLEVREEDLPQSHLLYSFIAAELHDSGVDFAGYVHPFMNDLVADERDQPLMACPGAGKLVDFPCGNYINSVFNRARIRACISTTISCSVYSSTSHPAIPFEPFWWSPAKTRFVTCAQRPSRSALKRELCI